jgi:hypothetical protein
MNASLLGRRFSMTSKAVFIATFSACPANVLSKGNAKRAKVLKIPPPSV